MKRVTATIIAALTLAITLPAEAKRKPHVVINKPPPRPVQPIATPPIQVLLTVAVPLAVLYDLNRRIYCLDPPDPAGLGGPGFSSPITPATGNVMTPGCQRAYAPTRPK